MGCLVSEDSDVAAVAGLLEDDTARRILIETRTRPMSATELSERCGVSESTIYRRVEELAAQDLIEEGTRPDEDGHHYTVYAARADRLVFEATDDGFALEVSRRETPGDRFTRLVEEMGP